MESSAVPDRTSQGGLRVFLSDLKLDRIATLSAVLAVFYVVGYVVAREVLRTTGLKGSIALRSEFYLEAGADFLADLVIAPLLAPAAFLPAFALAFLLVPRALLAGGSVAPGPASRAQEGAKRSFEVRHGRILVALRWTSLVALAALVLATYLVALLWYAPFSTSGFALWCGDYLIGLGMQLGSPGALFFLLTLPVAFALISSALRVRGRGEKPGSKAERRRRLLRIVTNTATILYLTMIPVAYGRHVYDWQMKKVVTGDPKEPDLWYVRRVQDQAIYVRCDAASELRVELRDAVPPLVLDSRQQTGLNRCIPASREARPAMKPLTDNETLKFIEATP